MERGPVLAGFRSSLSSALFSPLSPPDHGRPLIWVQASLPGRAGKSPASPSMPARVRWPRGHRCHTLAKALSPATASTAPQAVPLQEPSSTVIEMAPTPHGKSPLSLVTTPVSKAPKCQGTGEHTCSQTAPGAVPGKQPKAKSEMSYQVSRKCAKPEGSRNYSTSIY